MTGSATNPDPQRHSRFEAFEDRLVFSGQPVDLLALDPFESPDLQQQYELAPALESTVISSQVAGLANRYGLTGSGQTVVVIDSGIAYDHVALGGGYGNRVVGGWDFAENDANPYDDGPAGFHGTHVAGIIGSSDAQYQGVAPGVDLVALRVFNDQGAGNFSWVEQALQWVHNNRGSFENPITTVNLSLGTNWNSTNVPNWAMLEDEFRQLEQDGIFISVAAGNSFQSYQTPGLSYPAASPYVVPVASHGANGQLSSFSQRAANVLVAPGESIMSTAPEHLWGSSAQSHRFISASGTSMAAPYVAGASVLVREAMEQIGYQNVNQDMIEGHLRSTADVIYDSVTRANYFRVNLQRALDTLMSDDYGDTVGDAEDLGTLTDNDSVSGLINGTADADAFSFVAGSSGRVTLAVDASGGFTPRVTVPGVSVTQSGTTWSFDVQAGQRYDFVLDSTSGSGSYSIDLDLDAVPWNSPPADMGVIQQSTLSSLDVDGETWIQMQAGKTGFLTLEAKASNLPRNFRIELYDSDHNLISTRTSARLDSLVTEGRQYLVRLVGDVDDLDLKATNLMSYGNRTVWLDGTDGNNAFKVYAGNTIVVDLSGTRYTFGNAGVQRIFVSESTGHDTLDMYGDSRRDAYTLRPDYSFWSNGGFTLKADGIDHVRAHRADALWILGSDGDDQLQADHRSVVMTASNGRVLEASTGNFVAFGRGGNDSAELNDSAGNDRLFVQQNLTRFFGAGFTQVLHQFNQISADATQGGRDQLYLYDSTGNDQITLGERSVTMTGGNFSVSGNGFFYNYAFAGRGGSDSVQFYDTAGADRYTFNSRFALLQSSATYNYAQGFTNLTATSSGLGNDTALMYDTPGADLLEASLSRSTLTAAGRSSTVEGFDRVHVYSSRGADRAIFTDSAGNDRFVVNPSFSSLSSNGTSVMAYRFRQVEAMSVNGGFDVASITGSNAVDRLTTGTDNFLNLQSATYRFQTTGFQSATVNSLGGRDSAVLQNLTATDSLFARGAVAELDYEGRRSELRGFTSVRAVIEDDDAERDVEAVDFIFSEISQTNSL